MTNGATVDAEMLRAIDTVADELNDPLLARQYELEEEMIEDGKHRYWDRVLKARPPRHPDRGHPSGSGGHPHDQGGAHGLGHEVAQSRKPPLRD